MARSVMSLWPDPIGCGRRSAHLRVRKEEATQGAASMALQPYEYRSRQTLFGLPLVHIRFNVLEADKFLPAKGWVAIGNRAFGVLFAYGAIAVGCISMGGLAFGLLALGGFGIGFLAFGGASLGVAAMGGASVGWIAFGGGAVGWLAAAGGRAVAHYFAVGGTALAQHANDPAAQIFMDHNVFFHYGWSCFDVTMLLIGIPTIVQFLAHRRFIGKARHA